MATTLFSPELAQSVLTGMVMAAVYSIVFYAKKRMRDGEKFNQTKFGATVIVGAAVGASLALAGVEVTAGSVESTLASYAGTVALTESVLKMLYRMYKRQSKKAKKLLASRSSNANAPVAPNQSADTQQAKSSTDNSDA